jgi:Flp pilus assembly pilin Flp
MMTTANRSRHARDDTGASSVEYALLIAMIAAVIVIAVVAFGTIVNDSFDNSCKKFKNQGGISSSC